MNKDLDTRLNDFLAKLEKDKEVMDVFKRLAKK